MESGTGVKKVKGVKQQIGGGIEGDFESVIFVEPVLDGVTPTALSFKKLEDSVQRLQQQFQTLEELATNPELIEKVRGNSTDPLTDMWQIININKRLDASEQGINKLTSMLQDIIKGDKIEIQGGPDISSDLAEIEERLAELEANVALLYSEDKSSPQETKGISGDNKTGATVGAKKTAASASPNADGKEENLAENEPSEHYGATSKSEEDGGGGGTPAKGVSKKPAKGPDKSAKGGADKPEKSEKPAKRPSLIADISEIQNELSSLKNNITEVRKDIANLQSKIAELPKQGSPSSGAPKPGISESKKAGTGGGGKKTVPGTAATSETGPGTVVGTGAGGNEEGLRDPAGEKLESNTAEKIQSSGPTGSENETNEEKLDRCLEAVQNAESMYTDAIRELNDRLQEVERDVARIMEITNNVPKSGVGSENGQVVSELHTKIQNAQNDMDKLKQIINKIVEDKEHLSTNTNALQEQVELLKTIKADKEDLEDALADKADTKAVNRKVSYDQFDATCDDLTRGLEEAIGKLSQQESIWQQSLDEIQREIESKLDKVEISPLKEFVDSKLKALQEKLKALSELRQENEAAATKKMLRDVQCLSCDKNVVMRMEQSAMIHKPQMPSTKTIKPYLAYELDQIRKQQKRLPQSRNLVQFETALQEDRNFKMKGVPLDTSSRDHLCNRYCGGSHTIITPQQKVMRLGHFINQWGPQVIQLSEGLVQGTDGHMYRGRPIIDQSSGNKSVTCDPCDNKCNTQRSSKENLAPDSNQVSQSGQRKASDQEDKARTRASLDANVKTSTKEPSEALKEQTSPPSPPPLKEQLIIKNVSQDQSPSPD